MRQPTLFLTVGLPCTGKTTAARRIEAEPKALRLTKDEWVKALYGHENPPSAQDVIEGWLIQIGLRPLELGNNVVIDHDVVVICTAGGGGSHDVRPRGGAPAGRRRGSDRQHPRRVSR